MGLLHANSTIKSRTRILISQFSFLSVYDSLTVQWFPFLLSAFVPARVSDLF